MPTTLKDTSITNNTTKKLRIIHRISSQKFCRDQNIFFQTFEFIMQALQKPLHDYIPATTPSKDYKAILKVYVGRKRRLVIWFVSKILKNILTAELIFDQIVCGPVVPFRILRDCLILKHFRYKQHSNTNKLMFVIAHCFIPEKDRKYAFRRSPTLKSNFI